MTSRYHVITIAIRRWRAEWHAAFIRQADAGAAVTIADGELSAQRLAGEVAELLADRGRLERMARASKGLARPDAAKEIAEELLDAART